MVHRLLPDGRMVKEEPPPSKAVIDIPMCADDVAGDVLRSGVAILPGKNLLYTQPVFSNF